MITAASVIGVDCVRGAVKAPLPPSQNAAAISARNASAFSRLVRFWILLPQTIPRHCRNAKMIATAVAIVFVESAGNNATENVPISSDTAAVEPHDEIQSLQPTMNPAYSPSA